MTLEEIDAQITALESAKLARLMGKHATKVSYDGCISTEFATASLQEILEELTRLRFERSKLTGDRLPVGPVYARFGAR